MQLSRFIIIPYKMLYSLKGQIALTYTIHFFGKVSHVGSKESFESDSSKCANGERKKLQA